MSDGLSSEMCEKPQNKIILHVFPVNFRGANVFSFDSSHHKPIVVCM